MKTIYNFKKGDKIVRVKPAKPQEIIAVGLMGIEKTLFIDHSYMGEKLIFIGIANRQIYCQHDSDLYGNKLINFSLDIWDEGWDLFFDPAKLFEGFKPEIDKFLN
jgi:hypothetical protein